MGVPRFYRWLSERYPLVSGPITRANAPPVDHFYLDMNGIMHNCARSPENPLGGRSDEDIYWESCRYIDMLVTLIQPKRVLFLAVDGVAPRAKMNQQRARRFRAATALEKVAETSRQRGATKQALRTESEAGSERVFDSNCITPGTQFMRGLTQALLYYVAVKLESDRSWRDLEVIVSGAEVPGEGEHKIMEYIRKLKEDRMMPANTRHCIYGLDADLIFLGLVTHEPHFFLLREKIDFQAAFRKVRVERVEAAKMDRDIRGEFELLSLGILREYLSLEFAYLEKKLPFGVYDLERIINDFVLLAFLVGNDFIPHSPTLEIREGALNSILFLYKELLPRFGGYLTNATGEARRPDLIHFDRLEILLTKLGLLESYILERREAVGARGTALVWSADAREDHSAIWGFANANAGDGNPVHRTTPTSLENGDQVLQTSPSVADNVRRDTSALSETNTEALPILVGTNDESAELEPEVPLWDEQALAAALVDAADAQKLQRMLPRKRRYYREKLGIDYDRDPLAVRRVCRAYLEAIVWTLEYYTNGVASWRWFYPYHYAPFCSDMVGLQALADGMSLELGTPFLPLQQLLAVLPPRSAWCLPKPYADLMTKPSSPLADLYPQEVPIDMEGKRNDWEGIVLLPFMDEDRLLAAIAAVKPEELTPDEHERNELGSCVRLRCRSQSESAPSRLDQEPAGILSPFPSRMTRVAGAQIQRETISLKHERGFVPCLLRGTKPAADRAVGHPSLFVRDITHYFENVAIDIFGVPSKLESCIIRVLVPQDRHETQTATSLATAFLSSVTETSLESDRAELAIPVRIGYPWQCPALLTAIESSIESVTWDANKTLRVQRNDPRMFRNTDSSLLQHLLQHAGISLEQSKFHGRVRRVIEIASGGGVTAASIEESFPMLLIDRTEPRDSNDAKVPARLQVGDTVIYVGRNDTAHSRFYGSLAQVVSLVGVDPGRKRKHAPAVTTAPTVVIRLLHATPEPMRSLQQALAKQDAVQYAPLPVILRLAGLEGVISTRFAGMLMGKLRCRIPKHERFGDLHEVNLGLGLRFKKEMLVVPGYAVFRASRDGPTTTAPGVARADGTFLFATEAASRVLRSYREAFPGLLERMDQIVTQRGDGEVVLQATELFGEAEWPEMIGHIQDYLKTLECARLPLLPITSRVLVRPVVEAIQALAQSASTERPSSSGSDVQNPATVDSFACRRSDVSLGLGSTDAPRSIPFRDYELGDRVVYIARSGAVPFGARGTVIGVHPSTKEVDVVFDQEFIGGSDLHGRCSGCAGKTLDAESTLLNLSRGVGDPRAPRIHARRDYGAHSKTRPVVTHHRDLTEKGGQARPRNEKGGPRQRRSHREARPDNTRQASPPETHAAMGSDERGTKPSFPVSGLKRNVAASSSDRARDGTRGGRARPRDDTPSTRDVPSGSRVGHHRNQRDRAKRVSVYGRASTDAAAQVARGEPSQPSYASVRMPETSQRDSTSVMSPSQVLQDASVSPHRAQVAEEMSQYLKHLLRIGPQGMPTGPEPPHQSFERSFSGLEKD